MSTLRRYELTDFEWSIIEPLLPTSQRSLNWMRMERRFGCARGLAGSLEWLASPR